MTSLHLLIRAIPSPQPIRSRPPGRLRHRRVVGRRALALALALVFLGVYAGSADAHPQSTSAVVLDIRGDRVEGELQLPIDRLAVAVQRDLDAGNVLGSERAFLLDYVARHLTATAEGGERLRLQLGTPRVEKIDRYVTDHLVIPLELRPSDGAVGNLELRYDVIIEELRTHRAFVTVRYDFDRGVLKSDDAETLGIFDFETTSLEVPAGEGSFLRGFVATVGLGIEHVGEGADHLLFLLMLLIPAPLAAAAGRWKRGPSRGRSLLRILHVTAAFAVGHSITLALAGAGVIDLPSRPVETLIALSIGVSAVHAIRPLIPRGEVLIAVGFGLVHGLAFASLIGDLGLDRGSLVTTLLGFNLGIEVFQLLVVALLMPSLIVLSRTAVYPVFRVGLALVALVFSVSWMLQRSTLTRSDPFRSLQTWLVGHPLLIAASMALLAIIAARLTPRPSGNLELA